jgi:hypothetical protein
MTRRNPEHRHATPQVKRAAALAVVVGALALAVALATIILAFAGCDTGSSTSEPQATASSERPIPDLTPTDDDSQNARDVDALVEATSPARVYVAARHTCSAYSLDDMATLYPRTPRDPVSLAQAYARSLPRHASKAVRRAAYSGCLAELAQERRKRPRPGLAEGASREERPLFMVSVGTRTLGQKARVRARHAHSCAAR